MLLAQDIVSSEMGYMGFKDSESYGLTWKVGLLITISAPDVVIVSCFTLIKSSYTFCRCYLTCSMSSSSCPFGRTLLLSRLD